MEDGRILVRIDADNSQFKTKVKETKAQTDGLKGALEKIGKMTTFSAMASAVGMAVSMVKSLVSHTKELINLYATQEQNVVKLEAVLKATGNTIGMTSKELQDFASSIQEVTTFGDEMVINAEQILIATQSLDKEGLQRAIVSCSDLATAMGTDIVSSAQTLAYALQDPEVGMTRLRRSGIAFTDEEQALVKSLQEAGKMSEAQAVILDKLESKYNGIANAVAKTNTGKLNQISNLWGDIKEDLGGAIVNSLTSAIDDVYGLLLQIKDFTSGVNLWATNNSIYSSIGGYYNKNSFYDMFGIATTDVDLLVDYSSYSTDALKNFVKTMNGASSWIDLWKMGYFTSLENMNVMVKGINAELEKRLEEEKRQNEQLNSISGTTPATSNALSEFIKTYGSNSASYQKMQELQALNLANEIYNNLVTVKTGIREDDGQPYTTIIPNRSAMALYGLTDAKEIQDYATFVNEIMDMIKGGDTPVASYLDDYNAQLSELQSQLEQVTGELNGNLNDAQRSYLEGIRDDINADINALTGVKAQETVFDRVSAVIEKYGSLSSSKSRDDSVSELERVMGIRDELVARGVTNDYLDEIIESLQQSLEPQKWVEWEQVASSCISSVCSSFETLGQTIADGSLSFESFAKIGLEAIATLLQAVGEQLSVQALTYLASQQYGKMALAMAGSSTAFASAGLVRGLSNRFENGGIVGGSGITGDRHMIFANAGELILNRAQQRAIAGQLSRGNSAVINISFDGNVYGDRQAIAEYVYEGIKTAQREGVLESW